MSYDEWEATVPEAIKIDRMWRVQAFRLASYLSACAAVDTREITDDRRYAQLVIQLRRAAGSAPANIAEGYPRISAKDRVRYYEYALGSAAEAQTWYMSLRELFPPEVLAERLSLLRSITRLLLTMIRSSRPPHRPAHPA